MNRAAFRADAPRADALARERELQKHRALLLAGGGFDPLHQKMHYEPWQAEHSAALEWVDALAEAGHAGAERTLERFLRRAGRLDQLHALDPARLERLAARHSVVASFLARKEMEKPAPDLERAQAWLTAGGARDALHAAVLRELRATVGTPDTHDVSYLRKALRQWAHLALEDFAKHRLASSDAQALDQGRRLMERAAALGSPEALDWVFVREWDEARDKVEFLRAWFDADRAPVNSSRRPCLQLGAALERRGGIPGEATLWYARALRTRPPEKDPDFDFCHGVAFAFDNRWHGCVVDDAELAVRWHARAAERGGRICFDTWLKTCARGELGVKPDAEAALALAKRFCAARPDWRDTIGYLAEGLRAVEEAAARDPKWREVLALLKGR